jgi:hypothetical protein
MPAGKGGCLIYDLQFTIGLTIFDLQYLNLRSSICNSLVNRKWYLVNDQGFNNKN